MFETASREFWGLKIKEKQAFCIELFVRMVFVPSFFCLKVQEWGL